MGNNPIGRWDRLGLQTEYKITGVPVDKTVIKKDNTPLGGEVKLTMGLVGEADVDCLTNATINFDAIAIPNQRNEIRNGLGLGDVLLRLLIVMEIFR